MDLVIASNNKNKIVEIKMILGDTFDNIYSLREKNINIDVEETGTTFKENAYIKASEIYKIVGCPVLADDSGICVDALGGAPGVYSARYSGEPCDNERNNDKLLNALANETNRNAYYECMMCLYFAPDDIVYAEGKTYGTILHERRGTGGFGYDPIFLSDDLNKTLAEIELDEKNKISHRARALATLKDILAQRNS